MGPFHNFYCALIGFFAFAAIYHLILWLPARQETLLPVFSVHCTLLAIVCCIVMSILSANTAEVAESASAARISIGALSMITWAWSMSLVSGIRARRFLGTVSVLFFILFVVHTFFVSINRPVLSLEQKELPWGEMISLPRLGPMGWWWIPLFMLLLANYIFGMDCGYRVWKRDRLAGILILSTGVGLILNSVAEILRLKGLLLFPIYAGVVAQVAWTFAVAILIARDRRRARDELAESQHRLVVLSRQLILTQETERRHLARELHDEIGQVLTAIKMNLRTTQRAADASVRSHLDENIAMVDMAISQVRNLAFSLRPAQLDDLGLVAALHWLVKQQAQLGGFNEQLDVDVGDLKIPTDLETVCFRITQEALTNAMRHAMPNQVHAKLWSSDDRLFLSIQDDGIGFDVRNNRHRALEGSSFGLVSMQERASLVGGHLKIESTLGHGTKVHAWFPLERNRENY